MQWQTLNDVFAEGSLEVWYMNPKHFRDGINGAKPDRNKLEATHIKLGSVAPSPGGSYSVDELDDLWMKLQGEFWSPNGEARTMIRDLGLRHTSMSIGDCFRFDNGEVHRVESFGFEIVPVSIPEGCTEDGDCMIVPPGGKRTIPAKAYTQDGVGKAIDNLGNVYLISQDDDENPVFTIEKS